MGTRTARRISVAVAGLAGLAAPVIALAPATAVAAPGSQSPFGLFLHFGPYRSAPESEGAAQADQSTGVDSPGADRAETLEADTTTPGATGSSAGPDTRYREAAPGKSRGTPPAVDNSATVTPAAAEAPPGHISGTGDNPTSPGGSATGRAGEAGVNG